MVSAPYARKNGKNQLKLPFIPSRPTSRNQFYRSRGQSHKYIYLYPTRRRTARPANARTDTQTGGRTRRSTDRHADGRTDTQKHGRRRRSTDGHAEARTQTQKHGRRRKRPMAHGRKIFMRAVRGWNNRPDASCVWTMDNTH